MGKQAVIAAQIAALRGRIIGYRADIRVLEDAKTYIQAEATRIDTTSSDIEKYDVTKDSQWLGVLNDEMSENRDLIVGGIGDYSTEVDAFIIGIDAAISRLNAMISECQSSIASLESELASLMTGNDLNEIA